MIRFLALLTISLLTAGCLAFDKLVMTNIAVESETEANITYIISIKADAYYPEDSPRAEAIRIRWIEELLENSGHASPQYEITERTVVSVHKNEKHYRKKDIRYSVVVQR
jgi:hypothetical protein